MKKQMIISDVSKKEIVASAKDGIKKSDAKENTKYFDDKRDFKFQGRFNVD